MKPTWKQALQFVQEANHIVVILPENVDGDCLGSALALEEIFGDLGKRVSLHCAVDVPRYLHYFTGWDRIEREFPTNGDLYVVVDNSVQSLLEKTLSTPESNAIGRARLIAFDHHSTFQEADLLSARFTSALIINEPYVATSELLAQWALEAELPINAQAATHMAGSILSDSLGLTVDAVTPETLRIVSTLMEKGASLSAIEQARREFMKKAPEILYYKGELLQRIEYLADKQLAFAHIPWAEIEKYSDRYNPAVLIIDEMRLVEGVRVAVVLKTYPDGKLTAKIRSNVPIGDKLASHFGGGGHPMAAGFKRYNEDYTNLKKELADTVKKLLAEYDATITTTEPC